MSWCFSEFIPSILTSLFILVPLRSLGSILNKPSPPHPPMHTPLTLQKALYHFRPRPKTISTLEPLLILSTKKSFLSWFCFIFVFWLAEDFAHWLWNLSQSNVIYSFLISCSHKIMLCLLKQIIPPIITLLYKVHHSSEINHWRTKFYKE